MSDWNFIVVTVQEFIHIVVMDERRIEYREKYEQGSN